MNISLNNSITNSTKAQRPELDKANEPVDHDDLDQDIDLDESRRIGEELGADSLKTAQPLDQEEKAVQALTGVANLGRKIGSKALKAMGFVGITASALFYIVSRFKVISAMIAAPALGAFYIANNLEKSAKQSEQAAGLISDPSEIILKARNDSTYLESNFKKVIAAMVKVGEMKDKDPKKSSALKDLRKVVKKVSAKRTELSKIDKSSNALLQIKNFMDIYDSISKPERESELEAQAAA